MKKIFLFALVAILSFFYANTVKASGDPVYAVVPDAIAEYEGGRIITSYEIIIGGDSELDEISAIMAVYGIDGGLLCMQAEKLPAPLSGPDGDDADAVGYSVEFVTDSVIDGREAHSQRVFLWDGFESMVPLCSPASLFLSDRIVIGYDANLPEFTVGDVLNMPEGTAGSMGENEGTLNVSFNQPLLYGYDFMGWNTEPDGFGAEYGAGDAVSFDEPGIIRLYAQWEAMSVPVSFYLDADRNEHYRPGEALNTNLRFGDFLVKPEDPPHDPKTRSFFGWGWDCRVLSEDDSEGYLYDFNSRIDNTYPIELYVLLGWAEYSVAVDANGGYNAKSASVSWFEEGITQKVNAEMDGYTLVWTAVRNGNEYNVSRWDRYCDIAESIYDRGITLKAQWKEKTTNFYIGEVDASPGDKGVIVPVTITGNPGICDLPLWFEYDPELTLIDFRDSTGSMEIESKYVDSNSVWLSSSVLEGYTGSILTNLVFDVSETATIGKKAISFKSNISVDKYALNGGFINVK